MKSFNSLETPTKLLAVTVLSILLSNLSILLNLPLGFLIVKFISDIEERVTLLYGILVGVGLYLLL